ncbi:MAG: hypothetical protein RSF67_03800, partial [Clostridia bacterium]
LVISDNIYSDLSNKIDNKYNLIKVNKIVDKYPNTVKLNVCINNNIAIHNFKYTDDILNKLLEKYIKINVGQGYTNCNILFFGSSYITSDIGIYNILIKNNLDVLYIDNSELDIKLVSNIDLNNKYSEKKGFIGGCSVVFNNTVIFFGDLNKFKCKQKLVKYITDRGYYIKDFKNIDMIDIGSAVII